MTAKEAGNTFVLRVEGDSMVPDFPPGTNLLVDADLEPVDGDYVIASTGALTFRQLMRDSGEFRLKPLNTRFPTVALGEAKVTGVVREASRVYR